MDYGMVAKMVQVDLCSQGLTAASIESAPLLVESYLKKIGMNYNKDDVNAVAGVMTMSVHQLTPCNPGSAAKVSLGCSDGSDYDYDESEYSDDYADDDDAVNADDVHSELDLLFSGLYEVIFWKADIIEDLDTLGNFSESIGTILETEFKKENFLADRAQVENALSVIENFLKTFDEVKNLIEAKI